MKGFKRYGGEFSGNKTGAGCGSIFVGLLLIIPSIYSKNWNYIIASLIAFAVLYSLSIFIDSRRPQKEKFIRQKKLLLEACQLADQDKFDEAMQRFEASKIHGEIPEEYKGVYKRVQFNIDNA